MNVDALLYDEILLEENVLTEERNGYGQTLFDLLAPITTTDTSSSSGRSSDATPQTDSEPTPTPTPTRENTIQLTKQEKELQRKRAKTEAYKKHIKKRLHEHADLKHQVQELEDQLEFLKKMKAIDATFASNWENIARDLASQRQESTLENDKLKRKVAEQSEFIDTLQTLLTKRPRLAVCLIVCDYTVITGLYLTAFKCILGV